MRVLLEKIYPEGKFGQTPKATFVAKPQRP